MGKYEPLQRYLFAQKLGELRVSFRDVERILGFSLPKSAREYPAWWSNDATGHSHSRAWLEAGWKTEQIDLTQKKVTFRKVQPDTLAKSGKRPSLYGALKGMIRLAPGTDLTQPTGVRWAAQGNLEDE